MASSHNATESIAPPAARIGASARRLQLAHHPITGVYCDTYLRDTDSLLGMVARAGSGDTALLTQIYESPYSGASDSNAADDPNRRLEAYIAAARPGAVVRIMLGFVLR